MGHVQSPGRPFMGARAPSPGRPTRSRSTSARAAVAAAAALPCLQVARRRRVPVSVGRLLVRAAAAACAAWKLRRRGGGVRVPRALRRIRSCARASTSSSLTLFTAAAERASQSAKAVAISRCCSASPPLRAAGACSPTRRGRSPPPTMGRATHVRGYAVSRHSPRVHADAARGRDGPLEPAGDGARLVGVAAGDRHRRDGRPPAGAAAAALRIAVARSTRGDATSTPTPRCPASCPRCARSNTSRARGRRPSAARRAASSSAARPTPPRRARRRSPARDKPPLSARPALHRHHPPPPGSARGDDPMRLRLRRLRAEAAAAERFAAGELVAFEARLAAVHRTTPRSDDPSRRHLPLDPSFADAAAATAVAAPRLRADGARAPAF